MAIPRTQSRVAMRGSGVVEVLFIILPLYSGH
jgi:hypothetical protein